MSTTRVTRGEFITFAPGKHGVRYSLVREELEDLVEEVAEEVFANLKHAGRKWISAHVKVVVDLEDGA